MLKEGLLGSTKKIVDKEMDAVNRQIDKNNRSLERAQSVAGPDTIGKLPRMRPVTPEIIAKTLPWRESAKKQSQLTVQREKLVAEKERLNDRARFLS